MWRSDRVYIIADVGSNHCGSLNTALSFVKVAATARATAVKFQLFRFEDVYRDPEKEKPYALMNPEWVPALAKECERQKVDFLCTPFAPWAADVLRPYVKAWKIGSFEAQDEALREATLDKQRIVSLGMTEGNDAERMIARDPETIWLHCVSKYPTETADTALSRIRWLMTKSACVGFSDHTVYGEASYAAVGMGCRMVEHHIQMGNQDPSPDAGFHAMKPSAFMLWAVTLQHLARGIEHDFRIPKYPPNRRLHGR